ncbi:hypothetical protein MD484_g3869, partial [Candolleomyces efflorescens]
MTDSEATSPSIFQQIPVELWGSILQGGQGFSTEDLKTLCFVAPIFRTICRPLLYRNLTLRGARGPDEYSFERAQEVKYDVEQWKRDVAGLIRAERRLRLVGDDPSLSTFPQTIWIGVMPRAGAQTLTTHLVFKKNWLSKAAHDIFSQFNSTLLRTLPSFTCLHRLELNSIPIAHGLLTVIASHPTIDELKLGACSFPSPTFPIPSIRSLDLEGISQEEAPAAFCITSSQHLEELRIENMKPPAILAGLRARPKAEAVFMKLHRLTVTRTKTTTSFEDAETLLGYVPALRRLDFGDSFIQWPEGKRGMRMFVTPDLRYYSGPLFFARYVVPGRSVVDIRSNVDERTPADLKEYLGPLCLSSAAITTLHLPSQMRAPIWLLSRFVAEEFPSLVELRLPVRGLVANPDDDWFPIPMRGRCNWSRRVRRVGVEGPFEEKEVEGMVENIRNGVESEHADGFDDGKCTDYTTRRVSDPPASISSPIPPADFDVAVALATVCTDVVLDSTGTPSRHPEDYQEALIYIARGWYPLPPGIQTLWLRPGAFPSRHDADDPYLPAFGLIRPIYQMSARVIVAALGARYPKLHSVTLMVGYNGYHCTRIPGIGNGAGTWTIVGNN